MIKATGSGAGGVPFLLLGLSAENCRRLVEGQPIAVRADHVDPRLPALNVIVVGGETEDAITADMQRCRGVRVSAADPSQRDSDASGTGSSPITPPPARWGSGGPLRSEHGAIPGEVQR